VASIGGQVGVLLVGTVAQIIIARALGPTGKGLYSLTVLLAGLSASITGISLSTANAHFVGRHPEHRPALVGNSLFMAIVWGGMVTLLLFEFGGDLRDRYLTSINDRLLMIAIVGIVPQMLVEYSTGLIVGLDMIGMVSFTMFLREALVLGGLATLFYYNLLSVEMAAAVWVVGGVVVSLVQSGFAWYKTGGGVRVDMPFLGRTLRFSLNGLVANVSSLLRLRLDLFMINYFLLGQDVGYYSIAMALVSLLWYLPTGVAMVLIPYVSWRDDRAGDRLTPFLSRAGMAISVAGAVGLGVFGYPVIGMLFGKAFQPAYPAMLFLLPGAVAYGMSKVLASDLLGRGKPQYGRTISLAALILNVGLNVLFIPRFGIIGAAAVSSLSQMFCAWLFLFYFLRESGTPLRDAFIVRADDWRILGRLLVHKDSGN